MRSLQRASRVRQDTAKGPGPRRFASTTPVPHRAVGGPGRLLGAAGPVDQLLGPVEIEVEHGRTAVGTAEGIVPVLLPDQEVCAVTAPVSAPSAVFSRVAQAASDESAVPAAGRPRCRESARSHGRDAPAAAQGGQQRPATPARPAQAASHRASAHRTEDAERGDGGGTARGGAAGAPSGPSARAPTPIRSSTGLASTAKARADACSRNSPSSSPIRTGSPAAAPCTAPATGRPPRRPPRPVRRRAR